MASERDGFGKGKKDRAKKARTKAEALERNAAAKRAKKKRALPKHRLLVTRRAQKIARSNTAASSDKNKGDGTKRHWLKDLLCSARGYRDKNYPEANFRVVGGKAMKSASDWEKHRNG